MSEHQDGAQLNQEKSELHASVLEFVLLLLQALLRTGYFFPNQTEAMKTKRLYERFVQLEILNRELTFMIFDEHGTKTVLLEGIHDKPINMNNISQRNLSETYIPHLIKFFEHKELLSFSFSTLMEQMEFYHFIDIISEPTHYAMLENSAKEFFIRKLQYHQVSNVSLIFKEDFISTRPSIPWRSRMALSRLKKDFYLIPFLRRMTPEELDSAKIQILSNIICPLNRPLLAYSFLMNLDLGTSYNVCEDDCERSFFISGNTKLITDVGTLFLNDIVAGARSQNHFGSDKRERLIDGFCKSCSFSTQIPTIELLEGFFDHGLISFEQLPVAMKSRIESLKRMTVFLARPAAFLGTFENITDPLLYLPRAEILTSFVPLLMERKLIDEAYNIISTIIRHSLEQSPRAEIATRFKYHIVNGETPGIASAIFLNSPKELRTLICELFLLIGKESIPHLQHILIHSCDVWQSKQAVETLLQIGNQQISSLVSSMNTNVYSVPTIRVILKKLPTVCENANKEHILSLFMHYCSAPDSLVRREALNGICLINPHGNFNLFRSKFNDTDVNVQKIALTGIALSEDKRSLDILSEVIERGENSGLANDIDLAKTAFDALGLLRNTSLIMKSSVNSYLNQLVDRYCMNNIWKQLVSGKLVQPVEIICALTEMLGRQRRDPGISRMLKTLSKHQNTTVARRAAEILKPSM